MSYTDQIRALGSPPDGWENFKYHIRVDSSDEQVIEDLQQIGFEIFSRSEHISSNGLEGDVWLGIR